MQLVLLAVLAIMVLVPPWVGEDYLCDSGNSDNMHPSGVWYTDDPVLGVDQQQKNAVSSTIHHGFASSSLKPHLMTLK